MGDYEDWSGVTGEWSRGHGIVDRLLHVSWLILERWMKLCTKGNVCVILGGTIVNVCWNLRDASLTRIL